MILILENNINKLFESNSKVAATASPDRIVIRLRHFIFSMNKSSLMINLGNISKLLSSQKKSSEQELKTPYQKSYELRTGPPACNIDLTGESRQLTGLKFY